MKHYVMFIAAMFVGVISLHMEHGPLSSGIMGATYGMAFSAGSALGRQRNNKRS